MVISPLTLLNSSSENPGFLWSDVVGPVFWAIGFLVEATADFQKFGFKQNPANKGRFVNVGVWSLARSPLL